MRIIIFFIPVMLLMKCSSEPEINALDIKETKKVELRQDTLIEASIKSSEINNEDGPPFSDTCKCSFNYIAQFKYNEHRYDLIISGSKWDPESWSCSYTLGELIYNEFPPDNSITDFRIHLVDIDSLNFEIDSMIFKSKIIQDKLIATLRKWPGDQHTKCKFDPNKTGKYPKPKQWIE